MDRTLYTIRRGEDHLPHVEVVDLKIHGGQRLDVPRGEAVEAMLTADQATALEADGYDVKVAGKRATKKAAAAAAATDSGGDAAKE